MPPAAAHVERGQGHAEVAAQPQAGPLARDQRRLPPRDQIAELDVNPLMVLPKGAPGIGKLTKVEQAQNFGRDAKLEVNFEKVTALDLTLVPTVLGEKAKKETESTATAAGAGFAGMILLGPIGVVGAAFVHGKNITVPAGTTLFIQTQADAELTGLIAK